MSEYHTIEQNAGENQIEGGVVSISGSVEKQYRPFKDCNELIEHYQKKCESAVGCDIYFPSLYKPNILVKSKYCRDCQLLITGFTLDDEGIPNVWLTDSWITLEKLFDDFVFLDDSPCGVEV